MAAARCSCRPTASTKRGCAWLRKGSPRAGPSASSWSTTRSSAQRQFQEQINYQRGLEGELARSIGALAAVASARVHLAIPKPSVFVRDNQTPTASVLLALHPGRTLDRAQVAGIVHLVAEQRPAALPRARQRHRPERRAALAEARRSAGRARRKRAFLYPRDRAGDDLAHRRHPRADRRARQRARAGDGGHRLHAYRAGRGDVQAERRAEERDAPRSSSCRNPRAAARPGREGIPGALSNQPPPTPTAPIDPRKPTATTTAVANTGPTSVRKDESVAFEVDKTIQHTKAADRNDQAADRRRRDQSQRSVGTDGKATFTPLPQAEMEQISALVREAMGFQQGARRLAERRQRRVQRAGTRDRSRAAAVEAAGQHRDGEGRRPLPAVRRADRLPRVRRAAAGVAQGRRARSRRRLQPVALAGQHIAAAATPRARSARAARAASRARTRRSSPTS